MRFTGDWWCPLVDTYLWHKGMRFTGSRGRPVVAFLVVHPVHWTSGDAVSEIIKTENILAANKRSLKGIARDKP